MLLHLGSPDWGRFSQASSRCSVEGRVMYFNKPKGDGGGRLHERLLGSLNVCVCDLWFGGDSRTAWRLSPQAQSDVDAIIPEWQCECVMISRSGADRRTFFRYLWLCCARSQQPPPETGWRGTFAPVILIISEDILVTAPIDGGGRKEVYNHVQLVLLHILYEPFHCANYLFVPIICFAELVNPRVHLGSKSDCSEKWFTVCLLQVPWNEEVVFFFLLLLLWLCLGATRSPHIADCDSQ